MPVIRPLCAALLAALALAACSRGQGNNDTLADGAVDRPSSNTGSTAVGPGAPPVDSAGPGVGNSASQPAASAPGGAAGGATLVLVPQGPHGPYIADAAGGALYYVDGDADGSKCTGPCEQSWPPVTVAGVQPAGAPGLQGATIATVTRPDGSRQVTFNGHPLYRYAADAGAGSANGDGVKDKFGSWHLATPQVASGGAKGASGTDGQAGGATAPGGAAPAAAGGGKSG